MANVEWQVKGREFANCNCSYGCPCQFNAPPTHGNCRAAAGWQIDQGVFGTVKLDGLRGAGLYTWPGAVHEGNGTMQLIIDERARPEQREALFKIMSGQETAEMATMWWVYARPGGPWLRRGIVLATPRRRQAQPVQSRIPAEQAPRPAREGKQAALSRRLLNLGESDGSAL